jgi:predicted outer membrane repeat protein
VLERRAVLSPTIFTVDSTGNSTSGSGTSGTLPYVISQANANGNADGSEIEFDSSVFNSSSPQTITLGATLVLSETAGPEVIDGPGAALVTISGGGTVGVIQVDSGVTAMLSGLSISGGRTTGDGGGLENFGTATVSGCTIIGNSALNGGGVWTGGTATLTDCTLSANSTVQSGGGVDNEGSATLTDCTVMGNSASTNGGGIHSGGDMTVSDSILTSNSAPFAGGLANYGTLSLASTTFTDNQASVAGGAINNSYTGVLTINDGSITGNSAPYGGGMENYSAIATLSDVTFSDNSATYGGAIYNYANSLTLTDCTLSGNSATLQGGGLSNSGTGATLTLTNCTLSGNSAAEGGGLYNQATETLLNTIVAGNTLGNGSASDIDGTVSGSYNLIGTGGSGGLSSGLDGNLVGVVNTGLAPLGSYGGPTETMALLPGSPAVGAGMAASGVTTDERGAPRPASGAVDIGAFQDQGYALAVSFGSPQSTLVSQPFNAPLAALLTENFANAPLPGVTIDFSAPSSGASATLSASSAVTDASGLASVTATANATAGNYVVTASATGVTSSASYNLTNRTQPSFSGVTNQTITYGSTVTFTGTLAAGSQAPAGEEVAITVDGVTRNATIASNGSFSAQFTRADVVLNASSTAYNVTFDYTGDGVFLAADGSSQLTIKPEALAIIAAANTKVYDGTASAAAVPTIISGSLAIGDTADFTETYNTKNAGAGLTLTPSGTVDGGNGGDNYPYAFLPEPTGVITSAPLVITATSDSKVYDGTTTSSETPTVGTLYGSDTVTGLTQAFASKNVLGTNGSMLAVTGYTVNDGDGGRDYTVTTDDAVGTITPAALFIAATSDSKVYDGTTASSKTPTYGTLYGSDTVTGLTQAFTSKNVLGANGSSLVITGYTINDGDSGKDYTVTTQTAPGTITRAPLTVRVNNVSSVYGSSLPALTDTITGFAGGDNSSVVNGEPALATTAAPGANAGAYPITIAAGSLSAANYSFTAAALIAGTLTVTPAPLVITAVSTSMVAGQPVPAFTATYTGFKNGDTPACLAPPPVIRSAANPSVTPGVYPITVSGASSPNYTITYVPGTLTVILPPAMVESVSVEKIKVSSRKSTQGIVLQFSEALDSADAQSVSAYALATVPKNKRQKSKPVQLSSASYNSSAFTVTLFPRKTLVLNPPIHLTVKAASLLDALGRELDGNDSGQSGANFTAVLSKAGTSVTSARAMERRGGLSSHAVSALLAAGLRAGR